MSSSTTSTAPASSPPASTSFPVGMVGRQVELFRLYREGSISGVQRQDDQESTRINFIADGLISSGNNWRMETTDGLKFHGDVEVDENSTREASIQVKDNHVRCCRCCTELGVPAPPFSPSMVGMKVHFSEPDPHAFEASVLQVEKRPTLRVVNLHMTSVPLYSVRMGDRLILRSGLDTWEANVMYFEDEGYVRNLKSKICIHVRDEQVPQAPKCLPHTKIFVRPAQGPPASIPIVREGRGLSQRNRRSSAREENDANQEKIKVAINGYRDVGRALVRVALYSDDVDLVAINDPSITDQVSCMFKDSKCEFEVKSSGSDTLLFGKKEVAFFKQSDRRRVDWYMARTKLFVTSSNSSENEVVTAKEFAARHSQTSDPRVSGRLEMILGSCNSSTTPQNSWAPILRIRPINARDAKAVSDCFPLWRGEGVVSVVRFQGTDVIFELAEYPLYRVMPNNTEPSINFAQLVRWCFHMLSRIPNAVCDVEMSERLRRGG